MLSILYTSYAGSSYGWALDNPLEQPGCEDMFPKLDMVEVDGRQQAHYELTLSVH